MKTFILSFLFGILFGFLFVRAWIIESEWQEDRLLTQVCRLEGDC